MHERVGDGRRWSRVQRVKSISSFALVLFGERNTLSLLSANKHKRDSSEE